VAIFSFEKRGGGRDRQKYKSARPNDDRSVASERTHNQLVPPLRRGNHSYAPRPLPTEVILPYQGEQKVKLCVTVRHCVGKVRIAYAFIHSWTPPFTTVYWTKLDNGAKRSRQNDRDTGGSP
jgi:hypothetical protein